MSVIGDCQSTALRQHYPRLILTRRRRVSLASTRRIILAMCLFVTAIYALFLIKLLTSSVLESIFFAVFLFSFLKHSTTCFAISFCILAFLLVGGGLLETWIFWSVSFCLYLFYILFPNNLVANIFLPGEQGIYLDIRPPFLFYKLGKFRPPPSFFFDRGRGCTVY